MVSNAVKITTANKTLLFKVLIGRIVFTIFSLLFIYLIFKDGIREYFQSISEFARNILKASIDKIQSFIAVTEEQVDFNYAEVVRENLMEMLNHFKGKTILILIAIFLLFESRHFIYGVLDYVVGVMTNEHMTKLKHDHFMTTLAENIKNASDYGLYRFSMLIAYNSIMLFIVYLFLLLVIDGLGLYGFSFIVLFTITCIALRQTGVGQVMSISIVEGKPSFYAFGECFKRLKWKLFFERFISFFAADIVTLVIVVVSSLLTFGVSFFVTVPFVVVFFTVVKMVGYYEENPRKYYISFDQIVVPKELREHDEYLLNQMDI